MWTIEIKIEGKNEYRHRDMWSYNKRSNTCVDEIPEEEQ